MGILGSAPCPVQQLIFPCFTWLRAPAGISTGQGGHIRKSKRGSGLRLCHANFASTDLDIALALGNLGHKMTSLQVLVGKNQGSAQNRSGSVPGRCRATLSMIHLSCHRQ